MSHLTSPLLREPARLPAAQLITPAELDSAIASALLKMDRLLTLSRGGFPAPASVKGRYSFHQLDGLNDSNAWTSGFWPGMLWLAFELSGDTRYRDQALAFLPVFRERLDRQLWTNHHDLGFLYSLSCVSAFKLTGNTEARATALRAAELLLTRFKPKGGFIQAWGDLDDRGAYRLIIDCLMNIPLLFWASEQTGETRFADAARHHFQATLDTIIRPDNSTFHTYFFDPDTGKPSHGVTRQGFADDSCWARGQAWAIYGLPLYWHYARHEASVPMHARLTNYFLKRLPPDQICYWDLCFTEGPEERDSSAAAIAACGLLESLKHQENPERRRHDEGAAHHILRSLMQNYATGENEDGLLSHAVYAKPQKSGIDECCIWGDYFYLEALTRLKGRWHLYW